MKTKQIIIALFLLFSISFFGQETKKEKIKALKIAYITKDLNLTSSEAEKFWPIYNAFDEKQFELRMVKMRKVRSELKSKPIDSFSDAEANLLLIQIDQMENESHENKKKLVADLRKVISPVKILKLKQAEDNFNKSLLKQYKNRN
ncbi:sensor of ECF-type sigma factor [Flavobacterium sp.]|jgi:Spy/CpxP family protein refolding chaperone|uniref:sensor of ECF-type sigma factor n=1 Tax=Flavobacterium sp. TaxID=239 RepID=UPI0037BF5C6E